MSDEWRPGAPAGWYADPMERNAFRYWDGQRWTEHANGALAPPTKATGWGLSTTVAVLLVLGALMVTFVALVDVLFP